MKATVFVRPSGARTEIAYLPWRGPGAWYALLDEAIGASRRGQVIYDKATRMFSVARAHTHDVVRFLADELGVVHVIQYGGVETCVANCWNAKSRTALTCECACAGRNHGTGQAWGTVVSEAGPHGALAVTPTPPREYDVHRGELD